MSLLVAISSLNRAAIRRAVLRFVALGGLVVGVLAPSQASAKGVEQLDIQAFQRDGWHVNRVAVRRAGEVQAWLSGPQGAVHAVHLLCRSPGASQRPAVAHSARFDLRVDTHGATPEALSEAVVALAAHLSQNEAGVVCASLRPSARAPTEQRPFAGVIPDPRDARLTVVLERAIGWSLRDLSLAWLVLWFAALVAWGWRRRGAPRGPGDGDRFNAGDAPSGGDRHHRVSRRSVIALLVLLVLLAGGLMLRVLSVHLFTLNPDEHASLDAAAWLNVFRGDDDSLFHPPLARAVFRGWTSVWGWFFGPTDYAPRWWWRMPSVVSGTMTIALAWQLARTRAGEIAGLTAAGFVAMLPQGVFLSDLAKPYAMTTAAVLLWLLLADRLREGVADTGVAAGRIRAGRRLVALLGAVGALVAWLDYPAALAVFLAGAVYAVSDARLRRPLAQALAWTTLAALPLLPLALSGMRFAAARQQPGSLPLGFPSAPDLLASFGLGGGHFTQVLQLAVFGHPEWLALLVLVAALAGSWRADRGAALLGLVWLAFAVALSQRVYVRPQNLGFLFIWAQVLLAVGCVTWLRKRPWWVAAVVLAVWVARAPQLRQLYRNQVEGSTADMAYGPDCQRVARALQPWRYLGVDTLVQLNGDPHCVLVELVPGDPHQRAFPLAGHRPHGAPCYEAVGLRLCAAEGSNDDFSRELRSLSSGLAVVHRRDGPSRPARCAVIDRTGDFVLWWCARLDATSAVRDQSSAAQVR